MHPRTEEFLYLLLWSAEQFMRPTWSNLDASFETWDHRRGFLRRMHQLEERKLLERKSGEAANRIYRLTEQGKLAALGGRDPAQFWQEPWDGTWRFFFFDIALGDNAARMKLRRILRMEGFGCLQGSVWISPRSFSERLRILCETKNEADTKTILAITARPELGTTDSMLVAGAWDFSRINARWEEELRILDQFPQSGGMQAFKAWVHEERLVWLHAVTNDPLLPRVLWPKEYLGPKAWQARRAVSAQVCQLLS